MTLSIFQFPAQEIPCRHHSSTPQAFCFHASANGQGHDRPGEISAILFGREAKADCVQCRLAVRELNLPLRNARRKD